MQRIVRPPERQRIPVVLTVAEVQTPLGHMAGTEALLATLLYGSGLRLRGGARPTGQRRGLRPPRDHADVSTTTIYPHLLKVAAGGTASPLDALNFGP